MYVRIYLRIYGPSSNIGLLLHGSRSTTGLRGDNIAFIFSSDPELLRTRNCQTTQETDVCTVVTWCLRLRHLIVFTECVKRMCRWTTGELKLINILKRVSILSSVVTVGSVKPAYMVSISTVFRCVPKIIIIIRLDETRLLVSSEFNSSPSASDRMSVQTVRLILTKLGITLSWYGSLL
jgi:hypothetical protein